MIDDDLDPFRELEDDGEGEGEGDRLPDEVTVTLRKEHVEQLPGAYPGEERTCKLCETVVIITQGTIISIEQGIYPDFIICTECLNERLDELEDDVDVEGEGEGEGGGGGDP